MGCAVYYGRFDAIPIMFDEEAGSEPDVISGRRQDPFCVPRDGRERLFLSQETGDFRLWSIALDLTQV